MRGGHRPPACNAYNRPRLTRLSGGVWSKAICAQAPADKQALITDLFEKITLYDLKAVGASESRRPDGRWDVTLTASAAKLYANGTGKETAAPMDETVNIGLFTAKPSDKGFGQRQVVAYEKRPVRSGLQTFHFVTAARPTFAGIDPYNELIDRDSDHNTVPVKVSAARVG